MLKAIVVVAAATLFAGCASTREERAAAFQAELPQLVAACNEAFVSSADQTRNFNACSRLAAKNRLSLADPAAARAYVRSTSSRSGGGQSNAGSMALSPSPILGPGGAPQ